MGVSSATARVSRSAAKRAANHALGRALVRLQLSYERAAEELELSVSRVRALVSLADEHRDVVPSTADLVCASDELVAVFLQELRAARQSSGRESIETLATRALLAKSRTVALLGAALADGHVSGSELAAIVGAAANEEATNTALVACVGRRAA